MIEKQAQSLNQESRYLYHLQNIVDIAQDKQANVVVVGGVALRASMNQPVEHHRSNGTITDVDMIGLGPNLYYLKRAKEEISKYKKSSPGCPPVTIEIVRFSDKPREIYSPLEFLSGLRRDSHGEYYLTFRSIDQRIPYQTMDVIPREYGGVRIPTLPQRTTLHRYEARMGYLKPKDKKKVEQFRDYIEQNGGDGLDQKLYESYYLFCKKINDKHPKVIELSQLFWNLDYKSDGKISGSSGFVYGLTKFFRR